MWSSKPWDKAWKECKEPEQLLKWKVDCPKPFTYPYCLQIKDKWLRKETCKWKEIKAQDWYYASMGLS